MAVADKQLAVLALAKKALVGIGVDEGEFKLLVVGNDLKQRLPGAENVPDGELLTMVAMFDQLEGYTIQSRIQPGRQYGTLYVYDILLCENHQFMFDAQKWDGRLMAVNVI